MNIENSRKYYGEILAQSSDLKTDACCTIDRPPPAIRAALDNVHNEVRARYFGCGLVVPQAIEAAHILDLGSGSGQDAYVLAQLVGERGSVVGVDATREQLAVAERHLDWHRDRFGYASSNVNFVEGDIEALDRMDLPEAHFDVIVSNCVINLVSDKAAVFSAAHRLLKPGGELFFSDVYADRRVPAHLRNDPVLHGECLSGALYWGDFVRLAKATGFADPRLVTDRPLGIGDPAIAARLDGITFHAATYRLFKIDGLSSPNARTMAKPCAIAARSRALSGYSCWTATIRSKRAVFFRSAATLGRCSPARGLPTISNSLATSRRIMACSRAAAPLHPLVYRKPPTRNQGAVERPRSVASAAWCWPLSGHSHRMSG